MRVLLLFGGRSAEHEVSAVSAGFVRDVLKKAGHDPLMVRIGSDGQWDMDGASLQIGTGSAVWTLSGPDGDIPFDIVFPVLHGPYGEDGTVQGLCMMARWPFAGAGVMASSTAMNKVATKELMQAHGLPVVPWTAFTAGDDPDHDSLGEMGYPLFVKPARMGSSVGVSRVDGPDHLGPAIGEALKYDSLVLVEKGVVNPREIEVALLGEDGFVSSSVPGEIVPGLEWYDYRAKYDCPESRLLIPAPLDEVSSSSIRNMAEISFSLLGGSGFARADFLMDGSGYVYFNEINTIPGFTGISMFPKLWEATGVGCEEVIERIMEEAMRRHRETESRSTEAMK
jgi:D-alanine-D-alanine ligase